MQDPSLAKERMADLPADGFPCVITLLKQWLLEQFYRSFGENWSLAGAAIPNWSIDSCHRSQCFAEARQGEGEQDDADHSQADEVGPDVVKPGFSRPDQTTNCAIPSWNDQSMS